jgi:Icc-related predicted phosphoesterase
MIYAASDLHGNLLDPPADAHALLLAGDICPDFPNRVGYGYGTPEAQAGWLDTNFRLWLEGHGLPTVAIWGNHDFVGEHPHLLPELPWTLLQDSETTLDTDQTGPVRIWGTPWVPKLPYWAFFARPEGLVARADLIPEGLDVLMSHGPPYMAGDYIGTSEKQRNKYGNFGGINAGDRTLNDAIRRAAPEVTICGHIHEAHGRHFLNGHRVLNVAAVTEEYRVLDEPWTRIAF